MALPKLDTPVFSTQLISNGRIVKFRPFTVKEEKLFLMAYQSEDTKTVTDTIVQILNNCVIGDTDVRKLPLFDIEYLFLNLRARSIGEVVQLNYKCNNTVNEGSDSEHKCGNRVEIDVNILDVKPEQDSKHSNKVELTEKMGIVMKYPTLDSVEDMNVNDEFDAVIETILSCIDYIYDEENVYYSKDATREELLEFVESLSTKDLEKVKQFFDTLPKLSKKVEFKCGKCGYMENIEVEGLQSFFM